MNSDALLTFYAAVSMRFAKRSEALFHSRFEIGSYSKKGRMKVKPLKAGRVVSLLHQQNQNAAEEEETMNSPTSSNLQPLSLLLSSAPLQNHPNVQTVSLIEEQRAIFQEVSCYFGLKLRRACRLRCLKQQQQDEQDGEASSKKEVVGPPKKNKKKNKKKKKTNLGSLIGQLNMENISMHTVNRNFCQNCGYYYGGATLPFLSMIRRHQHQYLNIEVIREERKKLEGESTTTTPTSATSPKKKIKFTRSRIECYRCAFEKWESLQQDSTTSFIHVLDVKKKTNKNPKCNTHIPILNKEVSVCGRRTNRRKRNRRKTRKENDSTRSIYKKCTQINTVRRVSSRKQLKKLMSTTMMVAPLSQERTTSIGKARIDTESHQKTKKETKSKVERQNKNVTTTATNNKQKLQDLGLW